MTYLVATFVIPLAIIVGIAVGVRRGILAGVATSLGMLAAGVVGYAGLLVLVLP